ncbi:hypothetical protein [Dictyobacter aurantiacus]|uniref:Uncharacterized protein n=1 Tax=Dictyobacter aurantiacus TaxID=1936993 RepID=A0A401ZF49_9CHLR|nr:hypothetical protein [Dictyobacter aurantiacus]GCE05469.1 hypothetical protein KDAU_27980 [Dictyobacter aurantiacus]
MREEDFTNPYNKNSEQNNEHGQCESASSVSVYARKPFRCANCDIEILWPPTVRQGQTYCCSGCAAGGPCCCDYSLYRSINISGVIHYEPDEEALHKSSD